MPVFLSALFSYCGYSASNTSVELYKRCPMTFSCICVIWKANCAGIHCCRLPGAMRPETMGSNSVTKGQHSVTIPQSSYWTNLTSWAREVETKMGMLLGKTMDENLKKQQDFMLKTQQLQIERQIQMQNQMRERMMAMQIARARDVFMWFSSFYGVSSFGMLVGFSKRRSPGILVPLLPLTFILAYQYDLAYGTKMERMRAEADRILDTESVMLELPHGLPTYAIIEAARLQQHDKERLSQSHDIFL